MLVKIQNTGNVYGPHYTYNDPNDYIIDNVVDLKRRKYLFRLPDATYDMSDFTMKRADNSVSEVTANGMVYICTDDGKTIEKIEHKCQSYGLLALAGSSDVALPSPPTPSRRPNVFLSFGEASEWAISEDDGCLIFHPKWIDHPEVHATHIWKEAFAFIASKGGAEFIIDHLRESRADNTRQWAA